MKYGVFSPEEVLARVHVRVERYLKDLDIEYHTLLKLADTAIAPAAAEYLGMLSRTIADAKAAGVDAPQMRRAREMSGLLGELESAREALAELRHKLDSEHDEKERARRYAAELVPAMHRVRTAADKIETVCGDAWWPLPRYNEMLFVR